MRRALLVSFMAPQCLLPSPASDIEAIFREAISRAVNIAAVTPSIDFKAIAPLPDLLITVLLKVEDLICYAGHSLLIVRVKVAIDVIRVVPMSVWRRR